MSMKDSSPDLFADIMKRMKRIEGQARGIQRLLEEGADCDDIITQVSAIKAALHRVGLMVGTCQLSQMIAKEVQAGGSGKDALKGMLPTFLRL